MHAARIPRDVPQETGDRLRHGRTTNPALIPADHWEIVKPEGSNLTYGDETGNNVNLQRYKHVLETPVALEPVEEGTEGDAVELLGEGGNMILIPQNFSGNYYDNNSWAWAEGREEKGAYLALKMKVWRKVISEDPDKTWTLIFPAEDEEKTADGYGKAATGRSASTFRRPAESARHRRP